MEEREKTISECNGEPGPLVGERLAAVTAGSYLPNQAIIRLGRDTSFWSEDSEPTVAKLAVFVHEYMHFLHNYSTIAGIYDFIAHLRFLRLFINTVDQDGRSRGSTVLDEVGQKEFHGVVAWKKHISGDSAPRYDKAVHRSKVELLFVSTSLSKALLELGTQSIPLHQADIRFNVTSSSGVTDQTVVRLGSHILMESLAWEVEKSIYRSSAIDVSNMTPSQFPYQLGRIIFEGISGRQIGGDVLAKLIVLALQTSDPGDSFLAISSAYAACDPNKEDAEILAQFERMSMQHAHAVIEHLCCDGLDMEVTPFASRGYAGRGIVTMTEWCKKYLRLREEKPFFELDVLFNGVNVDSLKDLLSSHPPCPIVQSTGSSIEDIQILNFAEEAVNEEELGAAQGLLQFAGSHFLADKILPTASTQRGPCRFFGACQSNFTKTNPKSCQNTPWESFSPNSEFACWYSQGISAARGYVVKDP